ncbi:MAG: iron-containing alcohol dehydrogenase family protein [Halobacteriales archaeon]
MLPVTDRFEYDYFGTDLYYGRNRTADLSSILAEHDLERALVVTGRNVGSNPAVMDPVRDGLGDRLAGVFDETTPAKTAATAYDGIEAMRETNADVLIGVGGGSSLDIARQISVFTADGRSLAMLEDAARDGELAPPDPDGPLTPVITIPTTFAGADISSGGSIEVLAPEASPTGDPVRTSGNVMPTAILHDPALFETTPAGALAGSAMNGFNKGLETLYARSTTPITDATAIHGLRLLTDALPTMTADAAAMDRAVIGIMLVQFDRRTSIIHAFGHGFSRRYPVQQGNVHAIVVPHVLAYLFDNVDARRTLLAEGLGLDAAGMDDGALADAIVETVTGLRDSLDCPTRLRDLDGTDEGELPAVAEFILDDPGMARVPDGLDPTVAELEAVLRNAW